MAGDPMAFYRTGHAADISEVLAACRADTAPALSGREALKAVSIVEAVCRSAETGKEEKANA